MTQGPEEAAWLLEQSWRPGVGAGAAVGPPELCRMSAELRAMARLEQQELLGRPGRKCHLKGVQENSPVLLLRA